MAYEDNGEKAVATLVHEMKVLGHHLVERKEKTNVNPVVRYFDYTPGMTKYIHSRSIDDRCYEVHETLTEGRIFPDDKPDRVIVTEMTQEEVKKFEEDWSTLWKPQEKADSPHFD